jgi:hypothetical protein
VKRDPRGFCFVAAGAVGSRVLLRAAVDRKQKSGWPEPSRSDGSVFVKAGLLKTGSRSPSRFCFWRTGGLSRFRRGDLSRNQSGATGPSGHEQERVHAVNGKQGFQPDGRRVRRVYGAPSCASGEEQGSRRP